MGSGIEGRLLATTLPADSLLISIRRSDGEVVFPHGSTILQAGDRIIAYSRAAQVEELRRCFEAR